MAANKKQTAPNNDIIRKKSINVNSPVDKTGNKWLSLSIDKVTTLQQRRPEILPLTNHTAHTIVAYDDAYY